MWLTQDPSMLWFDCVSSRQELYGKKCKQDKSSSSVEIQQLEHKDVAFQLCMVAWFYYPRTLVS